MARRRRVPCQCEVYCRYCGRHRSRDLVGHYCKTPNCQNALGYSGCTWRRAAAREGGKG